MPKPGTLLQGVTQLAQAPHHDTGLEEGRQKRGSCFFLEGPRQVTEVVPPHGSPSYCPFNLPLMEGSLWSLALFAALVSVLLEIPLSSASSSLRQALWWGSWDPELSGKTE